MNFKNVRCANCHWDIGISDPHAIFGGVIYCRACAKEQLLKSYDRKTREDRRETAFQQLYD